MIHRCVYCKDRRTRIQFHFFEPGIEERPGTRSRRRVWFSEFDVLCLNGDQDEAFQMPWQKWLEDKIFWPLRIRGRWRTR